MPEKFEKITLFFERIKSLSFWDRILPWRWKAIRNLSYEAYSEYRQLIESLYRSVEDLEQVKTSLASLRPENEQLKINNAKIEKDINTKQNEITRLQDKIESLAKEASEVKEEIAGLKKSEANLLKEYENKMVTLDRIQNRIENERNQETEERHRSEMEKITSMKDNWARHEETVKETIKGICQKHTIEYVEKPPFKGNPDNTIKICDEFVVFDAKSPGTEDLRAFYKYIRSQTEAMKKYAKQENVKREVYLVIPSNTVDAIEQFAFNMGDYNVYVVTVDTLEPLILALRKIEDYEFVEELTPEERDNICRILGKFAHTAKRRIQIDYFFARQFLDVLTKCESDVPSDLLEKAIEYEIAEKLNPPLEKRTKNLLSKDLIKETEKIRRETEAKDVVFPEAIQEDLKALPLYDEEQSGEPNQEKPGEK
jgi:hypothetical protein